MVETIRFGLAVLDGMDAVFGVNVSDSEFMNKEFRCEVKINY